MDAQNTNNAVADIWQTEVNGQIYETNFAELTQWIAEGSLLPQDKVKRGNLRWIEAQKVPTLHSFFNARDLGVAPPLVATTTVQTEVNVAPPQTFANSPQAFVAPPQTFNEPPPPQFYPEINEEIAVNFCAIHSDAKAKYHCETCGNYFCKACPQNSICLMCGALCKTLDAPIIQPAVIEQPIIQQPTIAIPDETKQVADEVKKAANWFYWKAGITVLNSLIALTGTMWGFYLGMTFPQLAQGFALGLADGLGMKGMNAFLIVSLVIGLLSAGFLVFLGKKGGQGKKWALILGLVIFAFDGLVYLLSISLEENIKATIFGIGIHLIGLVYIIKGLQAAKK